MQKINWSEIDSETLREHEDLISKAMQDITSVQIAYPPVVPASVLNLLSIHHAELEEAWFEITKEMRDRGLTYITASED